MDFLDRKSVKQSRDYIRITLEQYNSSVYSWAQKPSEYATWVSWGFGAHRLLNMMLSFPEAEMNRKDIAKAKMLFELAMQPIITDWHFQLDRHGSHSDEEDERAMEIVRRNIQGFIFGCESDEHIQLYGNFHKQYRQYLRILFKGDQHHYTEYEEHSDSYRR